MESNCVDENVKRFLNNKRFKNEITQYDYNKYSELIKKYNKIRVIQRSSERFSKNSIIS